MVLFSGTLLYSTGPVYTNVLVYTEQVIFHRVPETHGHI